MTPYSRFRLISNIAATALMAGAFCALWPVASGMLAAATGGPTQVYWAATGFIGLVSVVAWLTLAEAVFPLVFRIGLLRRMDASFGTSIAATATELRYDPALGGGALMDLGTYCVHWCRTLAKGEPKVSRASAMRGETGVDISTHANLSFPGGVTGHIACDMASPPHASLIIEGLDGRIKVTNPLAPQLGHLIEVEGLDGTRRETCAKTPTYDFQLQAFVRAVREGEAPLTSGADSIGQMAALDAIKAACPA